MNTAGFWAPAFLLMSAWAGAQETGEALRRKLKDVELTGSWIYDDIGAGFVRAKESGKPLLVVFR